MSPESHKSPRAADASRGATPALREQLLDATDRLLEERPVLSITARDIARAAGVSDGVLYNYFANKDDLLVAALVRRHARAVDRIDGLIPGAGTGTVEGNLLVFVRGAIEMLKEMLPMTAELRAQPGLLHEVMASVHKKPFGPQRIHRPLVDYLRQEQQLGRINKAADPEAATRLLIGSTFMLAFNSLMLNTTADVTGKLRKNVHALMEGLAPK